MVGDVRRGMTVIFTSMAVLTVLGLLWLLGPDASHPAGPRSVNRSQPEEIASREGPRRDVVEGDAAPAGVGEVSGGPLDRTRRSARLDGGIVLSSARSRAPGGAAIRTDASARGQPHSAGGGAAEHRLADRTGRRPDLTRQLGRELLPLVHECIDMAVEQQPDLAGMVSLAVDLDPIGEGRAIVRSVRPQEDNEVDDHALLQCLEQSVLSLESLDTRESFSISMPIGREEHGGEPE